MKRLLTLVAFFATIQASAQQVNPVPDYVFRNQMSVGRNAVTDTAAYFSIGPRYGATKGFMPPIVGDTATFSSGKRNGLLIFSVQKNKFLYWDSVRVQWSDMAGGSGSYILAGDTSAMLAPYLRKADTTSMLTAYLRKGDTSSMLGNYIRHAGYGLTKSGQSFIVDTLNIATRAWRQKGLDSLAALEVSGSGTTNYVAKFTAGSTIGNSQIFDNGTNVGIGTASPLALLHINGSSATAVQSFIRNANGGTNSASELVFGTWSGAIPTGSGNPGPSAKISAINVNSANASTDLTFTTYNGGGTPGSAERLRITSGGNVGINNNNPSYRLDVGGSIGLNYDEALYFRNVSGTGRQVLAYNGNTFLDSKDGYMSFRTDAAGTITERLRIFANGRVSIGASPTDAGYQLDVNGTIRSTQSAYFATNPGTYVGIGTTSPVHQLTLSQPSGGTVIALYSTFNTANNRNWGIQSNYLTYGDFAINQSNALFGDPSAAGTSRIYISQAGNVGINQNSPSYLLDINGTLRSVNGANFATTSGNVGIGTASPTNAKLVVEGSSAGTVGAIMSTDVAGTTSFVRMVGDVGSQNLLNWQTGTALRFATSTQAYGTFAEHARINSAGELLINTTSDAGDYKLQVAGNAYITGNLDVSSGQNVKIGAGINTANGNGIRVDNAENSGYYTLYQNGSNGFGVTGWANSTVLENVSTGSLVLSSFNNNIIFQTNGRNERMRIDAAGELWVNTTSDAGDYKLQVVGNARVGTGKLDIASNTTFGIGVARSGTSEVAGQIYNSNGILYLGAESSAGGQIFSGSSAYAAVIGSGANYPLQFATNNITRATMTTSGNLLLGFTTDSYFLKLQVNGSIFSNNQVLAQGVNAQIAADSSTNISPLYISNQSLTGSSAQGLFYGSTTWNTTGNPSLIDLNITNTASGATSNYIKISDGSNIFRVTKAAEVVTAAPTGGSIRRWKLGEAATVSPTSPNRTIRVEIDGVVYYLHAKTTND